MQNKPVWKYEEYSEWARSIAKSYTRNEIEGEIEKADRQRTKLSASHLRAIDRTSSMSGNSSRRASTRNSMVRNYERFSAFNNALEIHDFYPKFCKQP